MQLITSLARGVIAVTLVCPAFATADVFITSQTTGNGYDSKLTRVLNNGSALWSTGGVGAEGVVAVAIGPDGTSYACGFALGYGNYTKLTPSGNYVPWTTDPGLVVQPGGMLVAPDGYLYALTNPFKPYSTTGGVVRFKAQTGASRQDYISLVESTSDFYSDYLRNITQDSAGHFFVSEISQSGNRILRFGTGGLIDSFIPAGTGGLASPSRMTVGPDGRLYVVDSVNHSILTYDTQTGAFLGTAVAAGGPVNIDLWADLDFLGNDLLVSSGSSIYRFGGANFDYQGVFASFPGRVITSMATGIPEPSFAAVAAAGASGLFMRRRRRVGSESSNAVRRGSVEAVANR